MKTLFPAFNPSPARWPRSTTTLLAGTALIAVLTGCVGYVEHPHHSGAVYVAPPVVETTIVVQDDYVYYPGYQVYYSSSRRQYVYLEGRTWVSRPAPPRVSASVLFASPSVHLDFHDSPSSHHSTVMRQYPKNWAPPGHGNDHKDKDKDDHDNRDNDHKKGNKGRD
jgi:hypothetical protein